MRYLFAFLLSFALVTSASAADSSDCLSCHREKTQAAVTQWEQSAHFNAEVSCADCHGSDHKRILAKEDIVDATVCGGCHQDEYRQHIGSRHGMGLHAGWGCTRNLTARNQAECRFCHAEGSTIPVSKVQCARFLKQSSEMGTLGCNRCHQVENNCASCHSNHLTSSKISRDPKICAKCHMGPDHPQWEVWETSMHGTLYYSAGPEVGPTCQLCHMPSGSHDVSQGLTTPPSMKPYPEAELPARREAMLAICGECHAKEFARRDLAAADKVLGQSWAIVQQAGEIILDLNDRNLLDPMPDERPEHPLRGQQVVIDGQMLYEDISHIERLFFKMQKYDLAKTINGAYHQNPDYTHWYGNAELKMDLVDIKSEASRLNQVVKQGPIGENAIDDEKTKADAELKLLKKRFERGVITKEEYQKSKSQLLQKYLQGTD